MRINPEDFELLVERTNYKKIHKIKGNKPSANIQIRSS